VHCIVCWAVLLLQAPFYKYKKLNNRMDKEETEWLRKQDTRAWKKSFEENGFLVSTRKSACVDVIA